MQILVTIFDYTKTEKVMTTQTEIQNRLDQVRRLIRNESFKSESELTALLVERSFLEGQSTPMVAKYDRDAMLDYTFR